MTTRVSAYTPLESLLLFQYLSIYGVSTDVFGRISDLLKNDPQIKSSGNYEPGRLSRDALRDFFLRLLKEEARHEVNGLSEADTDGPTPDSQTNSRKRKAASPRLPTIQEALKDADLIPQLVNKLYARYREHAIIEIREDERRYESLDREIKDIEKGLWDTKIQEQIEHGDFDDVLKTGQMLNGTGPAQNLRRPSPAIGASPQKQELEPSSTDTRRSQSPLKPPSPQSSRAPGQTQLSPSQHGAAPSGPRTPQPAPSQHAAPSGALHQSPYGHQQTVASPRAAAGQSPGMLPPPLPALPYSNQPQYSQHNGSRTGPPPPPYVQSGNMPPQAAAAGAYYQQHANQQPGYVPQGPYPPPVYPSHRGGVQLPPFQVAPQTPPAAKPQPAQQPSTHGMLKPTPPRHNEAGTLPARASLTPSEIARLLLETASSTTSGSTTPSSTRWKGAKSDPNAAPKSPTRPKSRSVSPVSDAEATPDQSPPTIKPLTRSTRSRPMPNTRSVSAAEPAPLPRTARTRRARGGSTTSSVVGSSVPGRTRSQSVMSHETLDNESLTGRKVKHEPSTPMDITETVEGTPVSSGQPPTTLRSSTVLAPSTKRKRGIRGTSEASEPQLQQRPAAPSAPKDKVLAVRNFSRIAMPVIENDIMSHKHASLFSQPVRDRDAHGYSDMIRRPQDMKSIKAAITAGGRAVNAAIASSSADENVLSASTSSAAASRDTSTVLLPISEDLVPPKGIVNSAQLEREVMRMFANAVMFNPGDGGDGGVVDDARSMFEAAAVSMARFREAERTSGREVGGLEQAEETTGAEEEGVEGKGKRRRLG